MESTLADLTIDVNIKIKDGWYCVGGFSHSIAIYPEIESDGCYEVTQTFSQAVGRD